MLLDDLMPHYDVAERHRTIVRATPDVVFRAIHEADVSGGLVTHILYALRFAPAAFAAAVRSPRAAWSGYVNRISRQNRVLHLDDLERSGFHVVAERVPEELVIGVLGRFWTARGGPGAAAVTVETFRFPPPAGQALAGWNFSVKSRRDGSSELSTETRVLCAPDVLWKFRLYWIAIRPGSGLIRRAMLAAIRRHAEAATTFSPNRNAVPDR